MVHGTLGGAYGGLTAILHTTQLVLGQKEDEIAPNFAEIVQNGLTPPVLSVSPGNLTFNAPFGVPSPSSQTITVTNSGDYRSTLYFTASSSLPAVSVSGSEILSGGSSTDLTVSVTTYFLEKGSHTGSIIINGNADNSPVEIFVTINVVEPVISISPSSMTFTVEQGKTADPQYLVVTNSGPQGSVLEYWTQVQQGNVQVSGSQNALEAGAFDWLTITANTSGLSVGTYTSYVLIIDDYNISNFKYVTVTINVTAPPLPVIGGTSDVYFTADQGGPSPAAQSIIISNIGAPGSSLSWDAILPNNRYSMGGGVSPLSNGYYTTANLSVNTSGLAAGSYLDTITIYSTDNPAVALKTIKVHITINGLPTWGAFESGSNGSSSDQWYSISSAQIDIWFWAQPFGAANPSTLSDRFVVSDEFGNVYLDTGFISTQDANGDIPIQNQNPKLYAFTKPAGVTKLRVQVFAGSGATTGWWYYGRLPGQLWY